VQSATVGRKFILELFHYFQLWSIAKISIFISTKEVLWTDIFLCIYV